MNLGQLKNVNNINNLYIPDFYKDLIETWLNAKKRETQKIKTYVDIRKQIIWGNEEIKLFNKSLIFKAWIDSGISFINDIINENGDIAENVIYEKLINKRNWISEMTSLKQAIPNSWKVLLKSESSRKSKVKTNLSLKLRLAKGTCIKLENITNKIMHKEFVQHKFSNPYVHTYWNSYFNKIIIWENVYNFLHKLDDNRIKQFKFKLIHKIVPSKQIRFVWKISSNPNCNFCNEIENYQHLFIDCNQNNTFWQKITNLLTYCGISNNVKSLNNIIIGYKVDTPEYHDINKIFALIGFSIYKNYTSLVNQELRILTVFPFSVKNFKQVSSTPSTKTNH